MNLFAFEDSELTVWTTGRDFPFFVYRADSVKQAYQALRQAMPERVRIAYAVKANPFEPLLACLAEAGAHFDCASSGELERIQAFARDRMCFFTGPGKSAREIQLALNMGVRIHAESWEDLVLINAATDVPVEVGIRIHPDQPIAENKRLIGGAGPSAFGIDECDVPELLERAKQLSKVEINGIHVFSATNQCDADILLQHHARVFELAHSLVQRFGLSLEWLDVGGGLGVPYHLDQRELAINQLGRGLSHILEKHDWFRGQVVLEPGRYLSAACGVYLNPVRRVKRSHGETLVICGGGINHLIRPYLTGQAFPVRVLGGRGMSQPVTLAGPLCTGLDRLGQVDLQPVSAGDWLVFGMTGAYGWSEGMTHFLSHPVPPEVFV